MPLLEVEKLSISFKQYGSGLRQHHVQIIEDLDLSIAEGEIVAIVGASGSGKSLLAHAIMGILPSNAVITGQLRYRGEELDATRQAQLRGKEIALVPQSVNFLDPLIRVGDQVRSSSSNKSDKEQLVEQRNLFKRYRIAEHVERFFPFQLSGGMARKVLVSTATFGGTKLIIADEPTPGLHPDDVSEALNRFKELAEAGSAILLITHDIEAAVRIADKVAVFYAGNCVEIAPVSDFEGRGESLRHPYSQALWRALPQNGFEMYPGTQPSMTSSSTGCAFADRCLSVTTECTNDRPALVSVRGGSVRCIHAS